MVPPPIAISLPKTDCLLELGPDRDTVLAAGREVEAADKGLGRGRELGSARAQNPNGARIDRTRTIDGVFQLHISRDSGHDERRRRA
jgi:hypothetical protein